MNINWNDKFLTGNSTIDEQHKHIFELLSKVDVSKCSKADLMGLLGSLQDHINVHFKDEEDYMKKTNYPDYERHKAIHDTVLKDTKRILTQKAGNRTATQIALEFVNYINDWFHEHYSDEDVKMVEHLKNSNPT